jgi:3-oxoacyl-[acyl-carrier protein] reductase
MSSVAATMSGIPNHALYAGSKAAVEAFTRSFAVDCGKIGVTVNAIAPGGVKSDMYTEYDFPSIFEERLIWGSRNSWHYAPGGYKGMPQEDIDKGLASLCPLKRVAVPEDIGNVVAFLAGKESEWINGRFSTYSQDTH